MFKTMKTAYITFIHLCALAQLAAFYCLFNGWGIQAPPVKASEVFLSADASPLPPLPVKPAAAHKAAGKAKRP